ncbi:hypothetical protein TNCV_2267731 [Trichonephila clavipes]|nr:hypothetical protein TNCV_2267731 [Trichonephila clavipes]
MRPRPTVPNSVYGTLSPEVHEQMFQSVGSSDTFGDSAVNKRTERHWFQKFGSGDLSLTDKARTVLLQALDKETLQTAIEEDGVTCQTIQLFQ